MLLFEKRLAPIAVLTGSNALLYHEKIKRQFVNIIQKKVFHAENGF